MWKKSYISQKYPSDRDNPLKNVHSWLRGKQKDDNAEGLWRINDSLYDLTDFIERHPGGPDWLRLTKGTDITEAFEAHHISMIPQRMLEKFKIRDAAAPRNMTLTFHEDGFYKTLKARVREKLKTINYQPTKITDVPSTPAEWLTVAEHFDQFWSIPHSLGSREGEHGVLQAPLNSESELYKYKSLNRNVALAGVDTNYNFLYVDVRYRRRNSDEVVFVNCLLNMDWDALNSALLTPLLQRNQPNPYFLVADELLSLNEHIMKVFPGVHSKDSFVKICSYRLRTERRVNVYIYHFSSTTKATTCAAKSLQLSQVQTPFTFLYTSWYIGIWKFSREIEMRYLHDGETGSLLAIKSIPQKTTK